MDDLISYIVDHGLDQLLGFNPGDIKNHLTAGHVHLDRQIPPNLVDLVNLHKRIRERKSFTILEFGIGHSTVVMADALQKNQNEWSKLAEVPKIRNRYMFQLFAVDASKKWIKHTKKNFPKHLLERVNFCYSPVRIGTFNGTLCHYYVNLPDIVPDFVYLDGPDPKDVKGKINGLSFQCDERTVMAADLLLMESSFLPGTLIIIDGRKNNARFLQRNLQRNYKIVVDPIADYTTFDLVEERLGVHNLLGSDFF